MSKTVIKVENLAKQYRLGQIGTGALNHDINRWWYKVRGKQDPYLKISEVNDRSNKGESDYVWSLRDINFEIKQGESVGIIGRNGAGKSTLLKILSRVTSPTIGNIKIKGRIASLLEVGTGFHPDLSGKENIYLNGAILGMTKAEITKKFDEIVDFSGVERYIDTPVKRYSSGMYVRLAFAVAAFLEPEILIVDEVLAVGDAEFQKKCIGKLSDVANEGRTVLFVSHNMIAIQGLCSRAILMNQGRLVTDGDTHQVIRHYLKEGVSKRINKNLSSITERQGNRALQFHTIIYFNSAKEEVTSFMSGDECIIALGYKLKSNQNIKDVVVAISINDDHENQLTALDNQTSNQIFDKISDEGFFFCRLPRIPLTSGEYTLNLFCKVNGEIADWLQNVGQLLIEPGDFYKTGKNMDKEQSKFLMDYSWALSLEK